MREKKGAAFRVNEWKFIIVPLASDMVSNDTSGLRVLVCTWNTQSVNLSEQVGKDCSGGREWRERFHGWLYSATDPDFLKQVAARANATKPHLIVLALQEDTKPGSYVISHAAPAYLSPEYDVVARGRMMGLGVTTWQKLIHERTLQLRGLRMLVLARHDWWHTVSDDAHVEVEEAPYYKLTRGKGGLAIRISLPKFGTLCFINSHLPFDSSSLYDEEKRRKALATQNDAFRTIYNKLAHPVSRESSGFFAWLHRKFTGTQQGTYLDEPLHVFMMGDLNYRVRDFDSDTILGMYARGETDALPSIYEEHDELHAQMRQGAVQALWEGVDNQGPSFYPTAKLDTTRSSMLVCDTKERLDHFKIGKENQRVPSWCDRILYSPDQAIRCQRYVRYDAAPSVLKSDHASVLGEYTVTPS